MTGIRNDGVRSLPDLLGRCRVDDETGCAVWHGKAPGRTWLPAGVLPDEKRVIPAARAAWLLDGRKLPEGREVYRRNKDCTAGCIDPKHGVALTRKQAGSLMKLDDRLKGSKSRQAINTANAAARVTPPDRIAEVQRRLDVGESVPMIVRALRIGHMTVRAIRDGDHPGLAGRVVCLPGASVFTLARAA